MKRVFALLVLLFSMFLVFAADLNFKAYFQPNNMSGAKYITVDILEEAGNGDFTKKVYQAATINHTHTGAEEGESNVKTVFVVKITGNFTGKITLNFTTGPLQAFYQGMYYIPEHRFTVYKTNKDMIRIAEFNKGKGPAVGDYPYPNNGGTVNTPVKSNAGGLKNIAVKSTNGSIWTIEYPVKLTIVKSTDSAGEFDYYSNITLEVEAEETV